MAPAAAREAWLRQAALVLIALPLACLAAIIAMLGAAKAVMLFNDPGGSLRVDWFSPAFAFGVAWCVAYTAVPALPIITGTELVGIRRFSIYPLLGLACGAVAHQIAAWRGEAFATQWPALAMGVVGGAVYWAIAGRHAGRWRAAKP